MVTGGLVLLSLGHFGLDIFDLLDSLINACYTYCPRNACSPYPLW